MTSYLVLLAPTLSFLLAPVSRVAPPSRAAAVRMQLPDFGSVGKSVMEKMGMGGPDSGLSEEEAKEMETRLKNGEMSFDDFLGQVKMMQKTAGLQAMLGKLGGQVSDQQLQEGQKKLTKYGTYVEQMDPEERANPILLIEETEAIRRGGSPSAAPRLTRIAEASEGATTEDVAKFVAEFSMMRGAAVKFANGESPDAIRESMMQEQQASGQAAAPNRAQRRMAAKKSKKKVKAAGGFGR